MDLCINGLGITVVGGLVGALWGAFLFIVKELIGEIRDRNRVLQSQVDTLSAQLREADKNQWDLITTGKIVLDKAKS